MHDGLAALGIFGFLVAWVGWFWIEIQAEKAAQYGETLRQWWFDRYTCPVQDREVKR
jgi:hypothetical protein